MQDKKFIDAEKTRIRLSENYVKLLNTGRGTGSKLAESVGKAPSFINDIKRGNPVNALHLIAVANVFGVETMLEIMGLSAPKERMDVKVEGKVFDIYKKLMELQKDNTEMVSRIDAYISGAYEINKIYIEKIDASSTSKAKGDANPSTP